MRLGLAVRAFWVALFDRATAERMAIALDAPAESAVPPAKIEPPKRLPENKLPESEPRGKSPPAQNPAITLLATLQRDARLIDLIQENLDQYQDAQVGAAARPCLKQCRESLNRILKIEKLIDAKENDSVDVPASASAARYRWIGEDVSGGNGSAKLVHPGWQATSIELPQWNGSSEDSQVIAPAQVSGRR